MRLSRTCAVFFLVLACLGSQTNAQTPGRIHLLDRCPGDSPPPAGDESASALLGVVAPLVAAAVGQAVKGLGDKLKESASEANVDLVHTGDYLLTWRNEELYLRHKCWVVLSRGEKSTKTTIDSAAALYKKKISETEFSDGSDDLKKDLSAWGYTSGRLPGILAILDLEVSDQKTDARLVPRFVFLDHSIREKKQDKNKRTITLEFDLTVPDKNESVGKPSIKFESLLIGRPLVQETTPTITSDWFPIPPIGAKSQAQIESHKMAAAHLVAAELSGHIAESLGEPEMEHLRHPIPCPARDRAKRRWLDSNEALASENAKSKKNAKLVARFTNAITHFDSCQKYIVEKSKAIGEKARLRSFDVTLTIKEFRKRPFAEFVGSVLSNQKVQEGFATSAVALVDPVARRAAREEERSKKEEKLSAYETALVTAEKSITAYEAAEEADKALKFIQMEADKRAANRRALALGADLPYRGSGTWIGTGF